MGQLVVGQIVTVHFPLSNLKGKKLRPALIIATVEFGDLILCQITSKPYASQSAIRIVNSDFAEGSLPVISYIRPDKLFTCDSSIIERVVSRLSDKTMKKTLQQVRTLFAT